MGYYQENKPTCTVDVLGTEYYIYRGVMPENDGMLENNDGYCDWTVKRIVVIGKVSGEQHANFDERQKLCLRHEIVHAFLFESGIDQDTTWDIDGQIHPEQMVQWIARQFPKMQEAFRKADAI